jgi:hypothetical protein
MPLKPNFLQRIKDRALDRIKTELAPQTPQVPGEDDSVPGAEDVQPSFRQRITDKVKNVIKDKVQGLDPIRQRLLDPNARLDMPTLKYRIKYAGQNRLLALLSYSTGQTRHVEVYSYRLRGNPKRLMLMGFCRLHNKIHCFDLNKITGFVVTDIPFRNRWSVEF